MWLTGLDLRCQPEPLFPPGIPYGIPSLDSVWGKVWEQLDKIFFLPCPVLSSAKARPGSTECRKREEEADAGVRSFAQSWRGVLAVDKRSRFPVGWAGVSGGPEGVEHILSRFPLSFPWAP